MFIFRLLRSTVTFRNRIAAHTTRLICFFASKWMMIGYAIARPPKSSSGFRKDIWGVVADDERQTRRVQPCRNSGAKHHLTRSFTETL
jgi:hypothetical protein